MHVLRAAAWQQLCRGRGMAWAASSSRSHPAVVPAAAPLAPASSSAGPLAKALASPACPRLRVHGARWRHTDRPATWDHAHNRHQRAEHTAGAGEKHLFFIRHGESEANVARRQGVPDINTSIKYKDPYLTDVGQQQAQALQDRVAEWGVELILCSPLTRTLQTALIGFENEGHIPIEASHHAMEYLPLVENDGREVDVLQADARLQALQRLLDVSFERVPAGWWSHAHDPERRHRLTAELLARPESRIAVVTHFALVNFLFHPHADPDVNVLDFETLPYPSLGNCEFVHARVSLDEPAE